MKQCVFILLLLTIVGVHGQNNAETSAVSDFKRVQIGINISPDICFRTLKNNGGNSFTDIVIKQRNKDETVKAGYTTGLNVCFNIKKFVGIETGIQYSNKGFQIKQRRAVFGSQLPPGTPLPPEQDEKLPNKIDFVYNFHYIDIPVKANFTIGKKKVRFFTSIGFVTNIFIKETSTTILKYSDHTERKTGTINYNNYNSVNISPVISAGIDYKINNRMNLRVEPTFRYGVLKTVKAPVEEHLYNGGLNISYYFGL